MATLTELLADPKRELVIRRRQVAMEFGLEIEQIMARNKLKPSELALRLGKSPAWVSQLLQGSRHLTLLTAVEVADALDCDVELHLARRSPSP